MTDWKKKNVTKAQIEPLCNKYSIDKILASIFVRRGITDGNDILYYLEKDLRFQHEPFMLPNMEDAVERILQAEEEDEKVLIFGDSDTDGITSTSILYDYLKDRGIDVSWRIPMGDDPYGLSADAVNAFSNEGGSLIITVDCGISNYDEVELANSLGIDVIITDHHNPQASVPRASVIVNPKLEESVYPFKEISGAAVAYKLVSALRFAHTDFYNSEITIIEINTDDENAVKVDCVKIKNLVKLKELHETIIPGKTSIYDTRLLGFLSGQVLYAWDSQQAKRIFQEIFGSGIDFMLNDLREEISSVIPAVKSKTSKELVHLSSIAKYIQTQNSVLDSLYNLYATYCKKLISMRHPDFVKSETRDIQLVGLAALADIMPMKNENRIFVNQCIMSIRKSNVREGLRELFAKFKLVPEQVSSIDLSWNIIPALNAAGRLGKPDVALKLLLSDNPRDREALSEQIFQMNEQRKQLVQNASLKVHSEAEKSVGEHSNKFCVVVSEEIQPGLTGLFATKLMSDFGVPSFALTFNQDICIGSVRSRRGFIATRFLDGMGDFFLNHGGHNYAAGFSFEKSKLGEFTAYLKEAAKTVELADEEELIEIDAEIPPSYLTPEIFDLIDTFEPYGNENSELICMTKNVRLFDAMLVGKKEPFHLKLSFELSTGHNTGHNTGLSTELSTGLSSDCRKYKFPAMFWGQGERLKKDITVGQSYDILYTLGRNYFNGTVTNQLIIKELRVSDNL